MVDFTFKTKPYAHQLSALEASCDSESFALLMYMCTGKSKVLIDTIAYLDKRDLINSVLIFAPKGVYKNWVEKEIPAHLSDEVKYKLASWASPLTNKHKDAIRSIWKVVDNLHIFVMNIEDKLELSIESKTWYDKSTGRIIGERKHHSKNIKNRTNTYEPFFYCKAKAA